VRGAFPDYRYAWASLTIGLVLIYGCKGPAPEAAPAKQTHAEATPFVITDKTKWKTVEEFSYKWSADQPAANFKLELPIGYNDPGDFIRVRIKVGGRPEFVLDNNDGWVEYSNQDEKSEFYAKAQKQNLASSRYVLILPSTVGKTGPPLIFLRSWGYASNAERLHVISFKPSGEPMTLLNTGLDMTELADLDGDGNLEIVGNPCLSESFGHGFLSYAPFYVYTFSLPIGSPAEVSVKLSKRYNQKHYYGWAGLRLNDQMVVVLHPPDGGPPKIMKEQEANKLFDKDAK
jgi:hypothetical protein